MTFHVGQKVVCVDAKERSGRAWIYGDAPTEGYVYTIQAIVFEECGDSLVLKEQPRHPSSCFRGYAPRRFRPIVERKTDISIFTRMLLPQGVDA